MARKRLTPSELIERLQRRSVESTTELKRRLKRAQQAVSVKVEQAAARRASVTSAAARNALYAEIDSIYEVQAAEIEQWLKDLGEKTAIEWHGQAVKDMRSISGRTGTTVVKFDRSLVQRYWELVHGGNAKYLAAVFTEKMAESDKRHLRSAFLDTFRQQSIEGFTASETHKALQAKWDSLAKNLRSDRFVDAAGRRWTNADYLNMLTRTTFAKIQRESYVDALVEGGFRLARITDVGDSCPICRAWAGLIVDISGNQRSHYPSLKQAYDAGWGHPSCDCYPEYLDPYLDKAEINRQRTQPAANWNDPKAVQTYNDDIRIREKRDAGMTVAEADRDLKRDKLKREMLAGGLQFTTVVHDIPDAVLDQMDRTLIPRIERAKEGDTPNGSRDSSLGGVLHLDPDAGPGQFRRALYTLEAKRGVRVADWRGLPAATDEDTAIGHFALFKDTVTPDEKAAILTYTREGPTYRRWNTALRNGDESTLSVDDRNSIAHLDFVLAKAPRFAGTTHRGIPVSNESLWQQHMGYKEGDIDCDPGFRSTSLSRLKAEEFAGYGAPRGIVQDIEGRSGVPLFNFSAIEIEKEVLFPRKSRVWVLSAKPEGDRISEKLKEP